MDGLRFALRALRLRPSFTAMAILTLALGIGANAAIFSVVDAALLRALPYPDPDRLMMPWAFSEDVQLRTGFDRLPSSPGDVTDFVSRNTTFASLAWMRADRVLNLTGGGEPERIAGVRVSRPFFDIFGVQALHGRTFVDADLAGPKVAVIAEGLWRRRFGSDPGVLGRALTINGEPVIVVGVLPRWFGFPSAGALPAGLGYAPSTDIWSLDVLQPDVQHLRSAKSFSMIGRLRDGVTAYEAQEDLAAIAADIARESPASNAGWTIRVWPLREQLVGTLRPALLLVLTAVGVLLLIACANVANLLLVRASTRHHEVSIRQALGADRARLLREMLLESVVLSLVAGLAGLAVAYWGLKFLLVMVPPTLPLLSTATLDWRIVLFTCGISTLTGLVFGCVPALQAVRLGVTDGLRDGGRGAIGQRRAHRMRSTLVVVEVAMAVILLVGAVLLARTIVHLLHVDPGFVPDGVLTAEIALPRNAYPDNRPAEFFDSVLARLAGVPGVHAAGATSSLPLTGTENLRQVTVEGRPRPPAGQELIADFRVVSRAYFAAMGIPQIAGEPLAGRAGPGPAPQVVVNSTLARTFFPGERPLGRRLKLTAYDQESPWYTIVGVVGAARHTALDSAFRPQVYVHHHLEAVPQMVVVLRTAGDPASYAAIVRAAVQEQDPAQPVGRIVTMSEIVSSSVAGRRFTTSLVAVFALLALMLSLVGLYAVVSHSVAQRTREMGVRLALGASPAGLLRLVILEGVRLVAIGLAVGLTVALVGTRSIQGLLVGVSAYDPATYVVVPLMLLAAAVVGLFVPARRAMRVDPMTALRTE
ncbi:MAG TPA: ABC transporter permease [Vicinamibacterales bacterium]|nr:ABC transporter permease [Vicinamibacterales bacterium]